MYVTHHFWYFSLPFKLNKSLKNDKYINVVLCKIKFNFKHFYLTY